MEARKRFEARWGRSRDLATSSRQHRVPGALGRPLGGFDVPETRSFLCSLQLHCDALEWAGAMTDSSLGIWLTAQVTFTELISATAGLDAGSRRHGASSVMWGAAAALLDFGLIGIGLLGLAFSIPKGFDPPLAMFLLYFAGIRLAIKSQAQHNAERTRSAPPPFVPRFPSLPVTRLGFAAGFWALMGDGPVLLAVWLAISLGFGWRSATLGALFGVILVLFLMLQTKEIGLSKRTRPSAFSSFAGGVVMGYGVYYFLHFPNLGHH